MWSRYGRRVSTDSAARRAPRRVDRLLPGLWQLRHYERAWLRDDLLAGVTVAAYLVPQVMAYAEVAGLPAVVGLWAIVGPLLVYAVLGSSRQLSVGPESTTALMTAAAVGADRRRRPGRYAALAAALALVVGVLCVLGWVGRLGFLADLLSKPVLVGYMAGIAAIMIASQLGKVTGIDVERRLVRRPRCGSSLTHLDQIARADPDRSPPPCSLFLLAVQRLLPAPARAAGRDAAGRRRRRRVRPRGPRRRRGRGHPARAADPVAARRLSGSTWRRCCCPRSAWRSWRTPTTS